MRRRLLLLFLVLLLGRPAYSQVQHDAPAASSSSEDAELPVEKAQQIALQSPDHQIAERLRGLFAEIEGLEQVEVEVRGGVVRLAGVALTAENRRQAEAIAARLAGVASVENDIQIEYRVDRRVQSFLASLRELGGQIFAFLPLFLLSLLVFVAMWAIGRLATRSDRLFGKIAPNPLVQTLLSQAIRLAFILVGLIFAMRIMGATALLGSVLGAAGVLGLAVGFAVRDTIENYIASILLSVRRPFAPNDHVIIEEFEGKVTRLNSRATFLTSFDGNELRIPNAIVYKAKITNFSQIPQRRFEFAVGVAYETDLCDALAIALSTVRASDGVMTDPEPFVLVDDLAASTITLKAFGWVDQRTADFGKVRSQAMRAVKEAFDARGICMPAPIQNVRAYEPSGPNRAGPSDAAPGSNGPSDTAPDRSLEQKVQMLRSRAGKDLLTVGAPRE